MQENTHDHAGSAHSNNPLSRDRIERMDVPKAFQQQDFERLWKKSSSEEKDLRSMTVRGAIFTLEENINRLNDNFASLNEKVNDMYDNTLRNEKYLKSIEKLNHDITSLKNQVELRENPFLDQSDAKEFVPSTERPSALESAPPNSKPPPRVMEDSTSDRDKLLHTVFGPRLSATFVEPTLRRAPNLRSRTGAQRVKSPVAPSGGYKKRKSSKRKSSKRKPTKKRRRKTRRHRRR